MLRDWAFPPLSREIQIGSITPMHRKSCCRAALAVAASFSFSPHPVEVAHGGPRSTPGRGLSRTP